MTKCADVVAQLVAAGWSLRAIARGAGVDVQVVHRLSKNPTYDPRESTVMRIVALQRRVLTKVNSNTGSVQQSAAVGSTHT